MTVRPDQSPLGAGLPHESALGHVTGEARYIDDLPAPPGLLHGALVSSPHARARILDVDTAAALAVPGVYAVLLAKDVPGENNLGPVIHDEPVLAAGEVHCFGQTVAVVIADSLAAAREAARRVEVRYEPLPALLTIDEVLDAGDRSAFIGEDHVIERGDARAAIEAAPHRVCGVVRNGGQEHFYLETQCALAIPGEDQALEILSSTQHPSEVQALVAEVLGVGRHRVSVTCPRMGGAFGGKETQAAAYACLAALGAVRTGRPVKIWLDRDTDMQVTGRRHPFQTRFRVGFDPRGRILGIEAELYAEAGWAADLSLAILDRALFHLDNAYHLPEVRLVGRVVRTNKVSNTAFRGFGGPQGMLVIEHILERIAATLRLDPLDVRRVNLYGDRTGWHTPYGQEVTGFHLPQMLDDLATGAELAARKEAVAAFNARSRWRKRGIALTPVKFGISFTHSVLNQAGALVVLYTDGTAQINHGGTEMGQGLYTKMLQVAAHALGMDLTRLRQMPTSTEKVPNTSATAASSGSDLNGAALRAACDTLVARLRPVAAELLEVDPAEMHCAADSFDKRPLKGGQPAWAWVPGGRAVTLAEVASAAWERRISLSATGYYRTPDIGYDRKRGQGRPFHYYAYGVGVSEVEVCGLTGEWRLRRVDILHDVGESLSRDIDLGQVEGAYVQGLGWLTREELVFDDRGALLSHGPSTYKIPAMCDIPSEFFVRLVEKQPQPGVIYGSKAVGEPPFMLAIGGYVALCRAVSAFGPPGTDIAVDVPATPEAILLGVEAARGASARSGERTPERGDARPEPLLRDGPGSG